ncbi:hypothetical protein C8R47DRAFT_1266999 [Mycena vitilis]|nr:hypothetical protein C8R47DRAFT_1266999 [Mycena vitilis]
MGPVSVGEGVSSIYKRVDDGDLTADIRRTQSLLSRVELEVAVKYSRGGGYIILASIPLSPTFMSAIAGLLSSIIPLNSSPLLPPELERQIFETTAELYPGSVCRLLCVSKRVYEWIEPIKFKTVTSVGTHASCPISVLWSTIESNTKPISFFGRSVRHLYLQPGGPFGLHLVLSIISTCSGLESLWLGHLPHGNDSNELLLLYLAVLRPRRLSIYLAALLEKQTQCLSMFTFVTHLDILDRLFMIPEHKIPSWTSFLALLPALTHLLGFLEPKLATEILASCPNLKVLVLHQGLRPAHDLPVIDDIRYVCMLNADIADCYEDWIVGVRGGVDFWARADAFVAKKRRGEINPSSRCCIVAEYGI